MPSSKRQRDNSKQVSSISLVGLLSLLPNLSIATIGSFTFEFLSKPTLSIKFLNQNSSDHAIVILLTRKAQLVFLFFYFFCFLGKSHAGNL